MKNKMKLAVIIALTAIVVFSIAACKDDDDSSASPQPGPLFLGATLNLSEQVWTEEWSASGVTYKMFKPEEEMELGVPGTSIKAVIDEDGILSLTMEGGPGVPDNIKNITERFFQEYNDIDISDEKVRAFYIQNMGGLNHYLVKNSDSANRSSFVIYVYVGEDVTISASAGSYKNEYDEFDWTYSLAAFNIELKKGWNALTYTDSYSRTATTSNVSLIAGEMPGHRWIIRERQIH